MYSHCQVKLNDCLTPEEKDKVNSMRLSWHMENLIQQPTFTDLWGLEHDWNNQKEWYPYRKYAILEQMEIIERQNKIVKKFTEFGFKVMDIPSYLFETLIHQRNWNSKSAEQCEHGMV